MTADDSVSDMLQKADDLWRQAESQDPSDHKPVYDFLKELDSKYSDNAQIKWRLARACKDMSETESLDTATRKQYAYEGKDTATLAVELGPEVWEAQQFLGALLGVCSRFEIFHKLASAREMKDCFQKACDLVGDSNPEPYHCLGSAEYGFADVGRAARLLGLRGTYEKAYEMFMKAESLCPHKCYENQGGYYNRNWLMIIKTLAALGRKEEAKEWHKKLLEAEVKTPDDRAALAEAKKLKL
jgi:tetratricopeptide (TPR) repeat protein